MHRLITNIRRSNKVTEHKSKYNNTVFIYGGIYCLCGVHYSAGRIVTYHVATSFILYHFGTKTQLFRRIWAGIVPCISLWYHAPSFPAEKILFLNSCQLTITFRIGRQSTSLTDFSISLQKFIIRNIKGVHIYLSAYTSTINWFVSLASARLYTYHKYVFFIYIFKYFYLYLYTDDMFHINSR